MRNAVHVTHTVATHQVPPCPLTILVLAYWPRICDCSLLS